MQSFEQIRSHAGSRHTLRTNDPYLISFDLELAENRHQGMYLAEMEDEEGGKSLRISTPIGPFAGLDGVRCLRFNWEQRTGYLAISDLDGSPYLHLCENRPYAFLSEAELDRVKFEPPKVTVYSNVTAQPHGDGESIKRLLVAQIVSPVKWEQTMQTLIALGAEARFVELAPGRTLAGLAKRINRRLPIESVATSEALSAAKAG